METHNRSGQGRVSPQPNIAVGLGVIIKTFILIIVLSALWIAYSFTLSYSESGFAYSSFFHLFDQSSLVAGSKYKEICVKSQPHIPEIGIFINITVSAFLSLYVVYNKIWGCPGCDAVLKRPILDLYDYILSVTIPMAYTYHYINLVSPCTFSATFYLIYYQNVLFTLLCGLLEGHPMEQIVIFLIIARIIIPTTILTQGAFITSRVILIGALSPYDETSEEIHTHHASKISRRPVRSTISDQNTFSRNMGFIFRNVSLLGLSLISFVSLYWIWALYNWQSLLGSKVSYQMTFSQAIPVIALFKPVVNIYYYMHLLTYIPDNEHQIITSFSTTLKSSHKWSLTFLSMFLFSKRLWHPAIFSLWCNMLVFANSKPDTVTITVRRLFPILNSEGIEQTVSYKTTNVFEVRHTFSDIHLIWPWKMDKIPQGNSRIVWKCSCGDVLAADFDNSDPQAVKALEQRLHEVGSRSYTHDDQTGRSPFISTQNTGSHALRINPPDKSSGNQQAPTGGGVSASGSYIQGMGAIDTGDQIMKRQNLNNGNDKKYFEVCVSSGRHIVSLGEINISSVTSDDQLFDEIWKTYRCIKGTDWRATLHNWFLEPDGVLFVLFGVLRRHQVGIYKQPLEIPPKVEVDEGRYDYYECPMKVLPPMPGNIFLHYLEHAKRKATSKKATPIYHADSTFLNRLPKKLETSIFASDAAAGSSISYGWGIHIVERPSTFAQNLVAGVVAFVSAVMCLIIFGTTWATLGRDEAIGIGQYTAGVLTLLNTALYFSLQAYCNYLSPRKL